MDSNDKPSPLQHTQHLTATLQQRHHYQTRPPVLQKPSVVDLKAKERKAN